jgi:hypothetical protein
MFKRIGIIVIAIFVVILSIYAYYGGFKKIQITTESHGSFYGASVKHTGDYREIGGAMTKLDKKMRLKGIEATKGFGIYFDNPKTTAIENRRAIAGSIIAETDIEKVVELGDSVDLVEVPELTGYTARFPYKGFLSFIVAVMKVYPELSQICEADGFEIVTPTLEIYDMKGGEIVFIVPTNLSQERADGWWNSKTVEKIPKTENIDNSDSVVLEEGVETIGLETLVEQIR